MELLKLHVHDIYIIFLYFCLKRNNVDPMFPGMTNTRARELIDSGYRMPAPEGTPDEVYQLMLRSLYYIIKSFLFFFCTLFNTASFAAPQIPLCRRLNPGLLRLGDYKEMSSIFADQ